MKISVVMSVLNEGEYLRNTIRSIRETTRDCEIIVVDDGSTDGCCDALEDAVYIKHEERKGVAAGRSTGAEAAKGDCIIFADGHHKFEKRCLEDIATESLERNAIVWPCIQDLIGNDKADPKLYGHGAHLHVMDSGREEGMIGFEWSRHKERDRLVRSSGLFVPYAVPRDLYNTIKWPKGLSQFGNTEKSVVLKSFFTDIPIYHKCGPISYHLYRGRKDFGQPDVPYDIRGDLRWRNQAIAVRVCFHERTWKSYWWPKVFYRYVRGYDMDNADLIDQNRKFQLIKKRPDTEFWRGLLHTQPPRGVAEE